MKSYKILVKKKIAGFKNGFVLGGAIVKAENKKDAITKGAKAFDSYMNKVEKRERR